MAKESSSTDIRGFPVSVGLLFVGVATFGTILAGFISAQSWLDRRISDNIDSYANVKIYPRVVELERSVIQIQKDQGKIVALIETQDHTRNRQYNEKNQRRE